MLLLFQTDHYRRVNAGHKFSTRNFREFGSGMFQGRWKRTLISKAMQEAGRGASYRICVLSLKALGVHPDLASPVWCNWFKCILPSVEVHYW